MASDEAEGTRARRGCANHPARAAIGRCPRCARAVCQECQTRIDGILHCRDCLGDTARELASRRASPWRRVGTGLFAIALLGTALATSLLGVQTVGFVAGRLARIGAIAADAPMGERPR